MSESRLMAVLVVGLVTGFVAFVVAGMGLLWHAEHVDCLRLGEQTGYPTRMVGSWSGGGCYVNVDGRWIPDTRYRMVEVDQ